MGLVYLLSAYTTMSVFVTSTVSMFGIALAVDYSLFILMRFREELRAGRQPQEAIDAAMATSGLAVALSGMTVVASLTGYLPDRHPGAGVDGHRRDSRGRRGDADSDDHDAGGAGDVRPSGRQAVGGVCTCRGAPKRTQSRFWTHWIGWRDAPAVGVGADGVGGTARDGGAGAVNGVGQQPASPIQLVTRDPRGGRRRRPRRWVPARSARCRCW